MRSEGTASAPRQVHVAHVGHTLVDVTGWWLAGPAPILTEQQLAILSKIGCVRAQGFLVAPALPVAQFEDLVRQG